MAFEVMWLVPYVTAVGGILVVKRLLHVIDVKNRARKLKQKALKKRKDEQEYIQEQIDSYKTDMTQEEEDAVLMLNASELVKKFESGDLKAIDVLKIYRHKACVVTKNLNCVTEIIKDCTETANSLLDKYTCNMPLYGVPVSIKETLQTKGAPSTMGWAKYLDNIATEDCVLVKVLKHCGAVPFVKTNISQMTLSFASSNPIYGETSNSHNPAFGPGGSSSGEGCIIGAGASILGFGTDTAGSIRCPAHLCGICGLKPTTGRLSLSGLIPPCMMTSVSTSVGPMAPDVDTLVMAMRAICCDKMFELDPTVVPIKFREKIYNSKLPLRIGYFDDNSFIKPVPACQRVVKMTKEGLEKAGHTFVPFKVPEPEVVYYATLKALWADGGKSCVKALEDEEVDQRLMYLYKKWTMPRWIMKIFAAYLRLKSKRMAIDLLSYAGGGDTSTYNCWKTRMEIEQYKAKFWAEWRFKQNLDAMICPVFPVVACPKESFDNPSGIMSYTVLFNTLNYPAGTVPVSKVTQEDIDDLQNYQGHYGDSWDEQIKKITTQSIGMPIGVQCVSSPFSEEVCLRLMKEVETLLPLKKFK